MKGDDNILEEDDVLVPQRYGESRDDRGKDVKQLCSSIKLMSLVDQSVERLIDGLTDHLAARNQLRVEFVQDVLQVVPLDGLLRVKEFEELLHELRRHVDLKALHVDRLVDDQLQEELVDALDVGPGRVHLILLLDAGL